MREHMTIFVRWVQRKARNRKAVKVVGSRKKGGCLLPFLPLYGGPSNATTKMKSSDGSKRSLRDMTLSSSLTSPHPFSHAASDRIRSTRHNGVCTSGITANDNLGGITCPQNGRGGSPNILYESSCPMAINIKGIKAMLSGFRVVGVIVRRMPRVLVVPKGIQQRNGSVDH